ncbi:hypothetical protein LINGRAHAP2_LOCUS21153 [Linum grandiflorum]
MDRDWFIKVEDIYREGNRIADYLASPGHRLSLSVYLIDISDLTQPLKLLYALFSLFHPYLIMNNKIAVDMS